MVASILVSGSLLLGRLSGFIREALLATSLGTSSSADAVILILTLPDFMVGLLISGGISAALVPVLKQHSHIDRIFILRRAGLVITLGFAGIAILLAIFAEMVIRLFIPQVNFSTLTDFVTGFNLSMLALPVAALIGVSASYLNTVGRFTISGLSVLVFNGTICVYLLLPFVDPRDLIFFGLVVVLAVLLRLLFQMGFMLEAFQKLKGTPPPWPKRFIPRFIAGTASFSVIVGSVIVFRSLHAINGEGQMAAFNYAHKLFELPAALLIAPIAIVLLQILSGLDRTQKRSFTNHTLQGMLSGLTIACIATSLGWLYMPTAVDIIFGHGVMSTAESDRITWIARILVSALPFYALLQVGAIALNVQGRPNRVTANSVAGLVAGVAFWGLFSSLGWSGNAAGAGFLIFNIVASMLCIRSIFGWRFLSTSTFREVAVMLLKISFTSLPFVYLQSRHPSESAWITITSIFGAALLMAAVNINNIRPLIDMKISKD